MVGHTYRGEQTKSCQPTSKQRKPEPKQARITRARTTDPNQSPVGPNARANPKHPKPGEVPSTRLASEAATARFEQVFVNVRDRFPTVGPPNKDALGTPLAKDHLMLTIRKLTLGQGYRYLMDSIAVGDGRGDHSSELTRYYAESGTPPGRWKGNGLADLGGGKGIEHDSEVTESQLWNMLGLVADPLTGDPVGQALRIRRVSTADRISAKVARLPETLTGEDRALEVETIKAEEARAEKRIGKPVAGFDLTFSPSKSVSVAWALADAETKAIIYLCHQRAIDYVLGYAEREVIHSRSGKNGVLQEDVTGISLEPPTNSVNWSPKTEESAS